jgi:glycosyltransferase involved in cell wall biosynthesis
VVSLVRHKFANVRFVFLGDWEISDDLHQLAFACNLMPLIKVLTMEAKNRAMASADVVICDSEPGSSGAALETLARGRALLAADTAEHREITPEGRGCLWFHSREVADIANRAAFLAANSQFRRALAMAGHDHVLETRSPEIVGARYDSVYRHAFSKRKGRDSSTPRAHLIPLQVGS